MPIMSFLPPVSPRIPALAVALIALTSVLSSPVSARTADDVVGQWDVMHEQGRRPCRITLNAERSDKGDFFVGVPVACRRGMPVLAKVGRWTLADATHLTLTDPGGRAILTLEADGDAFSGKSPDGATYRLVFVPAMGRSATSGDASDVLQAKPPQIINLATGTTTVAATSVPSKPSKVSPERMGDLAGRYAVLRDKTHDTGCMLTLDDKTRVKGGARAALAPACRDQGIVVFDPTVWQIVNGRLVLTAKAGHVTHLDKQGDGTWLKDPAEGKSLSLKKL
jgi:hypothetical protein